MIVLLEKIMNNTERIPFCITKDCLGTIKGGKGGGSVGY